MKKILIFDKNEILKGIDALLQGNALMGFCKKFHRVGMLTLGLWDEQDLVRKVHVLFQQHFDII